MQSGELPDGNGVFTLPAREAMASTIVVKIAEVK